MCTIGHKYNIFIYIDINIVNMCIYIIYIYICNTFEKTYIYTYIYICAWRVDGHPLVVWSGMLVLVAIVLFLVNTIPVPAAGAAAALPPQGREGGGYYTDP